MSLLKVSFGNGQFTIAAVTEFYPGIPTGEIRAEEFVPVLDVWGDDKVGSLIVKTGNTTK